jgi:hypothetical protein
MVEGPQVRALATAVSGVKLAQGAGPGGSFLIDEYGRVLVPASEGSGVSVFVVGECSGPLRFENPFRPGSILDLYDDKGLKLGDPWKRPYVGMQYQLSKHDELYFWATDTAGSTKQTPRAQDATLIASLRSLRPWGAVRYLVCPGGVVITKVPPLWEPRYAGRVDLATWFPKEEVR